MGAFVDRQCKEMVTTGHSLVPSSDAEEHGSALARSKPFRQVGALPWRFSKSGSLRIMLITSSSGRHWIIPKGWPMTGKSEFDSAAQEALEEAGVIGRVASIPIGEFEFAKSADPQSARRVRVYPLEVRGTLVRWQEWEKRKRRWFSVNEAVEAVHNAQLAAVVKGYGMANIQLRSNN